VAQLDALTGVYDMTPGFAITIARDGSHLTAQATGQSSMRILAKTPTLFYARTAKAEFEFVHGSDGAVKTMILHQHGADMPCQRRPSATTAAVPPASP
jgi:hypothetical protein